MDLPKNGISTKYNIVEGDKTKFKLLVDSSPGDQTLLYLVTEQTFNTEHKVSLIFKIIERQCKRAYWGVQYRDLRNNNASFDENQSTFT